MKAKVKDIPVGTYSACYVYNQDCKNLAGTIIDVMIDLYRHNYFLKTDNTNLGFHESWLEFIDDNPQD